MLAYPSGQDWPDSKKDRYERNIVGFFHDTTYTDPLGTFTLMVKSGEVYTTSDMKRERGFLEG